MINLPLGFLQETLWVQKSPNVSSRYFRLKGLKANSWCDLLPLKNCRILLFFHEMYNCSTGWFHPAMVFPRAQEKKRSRRSHSFHLPSPSSLFGRSFFFLSRWFCWRSHSLQLSSAEKPQISALFASYYYFFWLASPRSHTKGGLSAESITGDMNGENIYVSMFCFGRFLWSKHDVSGQENRVV